LGATLDTSSKGFHERNTKVAQSDYLIAFTFGLDRPVSGGTLDTWKKATTNNKFHFTIPLNFDDDDQLKQNSLNRTLKRTLNDNNNDSTDNNNDSLKKRKK